MVGSEEKASAFLKVIFGVPEETLIDGVVPEGSCRGLTLL